MTIISEDFNLLHINIVLIVFLLVLINIVITMKVSKTLRYTSFLLCSSYMICSILIIAVYITFSWYLALGVGLLISDLMSNWLKKQIAIAAEEELKGGFGLTKKIRLEQIEQFILNASPVDLNRAKKFEKNPVKYNKVMFMAICNVMGFLTALGIMVE